MHDIEQWMTAVRAELDGLHRDNEQLRADNAELRAVTGRLEADNLALRAQLAAPGRPDTAGPIAETTGPLTAGPGRAGTDRCEPVTAERTGARPVSRRGMLLAAAGAAGGVLVAQASPAAAANGQPILLGQLNTATATTTVSTSAVAGVQGKTSAGAGYGVNGWATAPFGSTAGVYGESNSSKGTGVLGIANHATGSTYGLYGRADSTSGIGVYGSNPATAGLGSGFAMYASGRFKATGRTYLGAPAAAPADTDLNLGSLSFYLDQANNKLKVRVKYSDGTLRTATVALA